MHDDLILVLNAGSTNLKFGIYTLAAGSAPAERLRGRVEQQQDAATLCARYADGTALPPVTWPAGDAAFLSGRLIEWVERQFPTGRLLAVGHRVVHGGNRFTEAVPITPEVIHALEALKPFAPLHQPHNLAPMRCLAELRPGLIQVACFDTAFHATLPKLARLYALPSALFDQGIRRYGFHGLSYRYVSKVLARQSPLQGPTVIAHLGGGASVCGLLNGQSVACSMGMTALDGLPMGTRCGSIDPGILLYLLGEQGMSAADLEHMLYRESGLLGLSGLSDDMRVLLASTRPAAQEAVAFFVRRTAREIAALATEIGGLETLVFTGGIGERSSPIRERIVQTLQWIGLRIDPVLNQSCSENNPTRLDTADSAAQIWTIPTDEESMIAEDTARFCA